MRKIMKKTMRKIASVLAACALAMCSGISAYADEFIGYDAVHGDPTIAESDDYVRSPADVARYYPNGSYFSVNRKACTCHGIDGDPNLNCNCGRYRYYMNGYDGSDGYGTAYQCAGFAKFCYYQYNDGMDVPHRYDTDFGLCKELSSATLYSHLKKAGAYSYWRGYTAKKSPHSVFVVGFTSETVTIWEANYPGNCRVSNVTLSYDEFLKRIQRLGFCYTSEGDFYVP